MSDSPKLSFGGMKMSLKPAKKAVRTSAFSLEADEEPTPSTSNLGPNSSGKSGGKGLSTATLSRAQKAKQVADLELDSSVYEYDEVYDNMKEGGRLALLEKKKDAGERKPKYIGRLLETAEIRKRDRVRAEDKMVQREREMEGEDFKDKDAFVTPGYLLQQEELRKNEEEEKKRDEKSGKSGGMSSFFKQYLESSAKEHDIAVAASLSKTPLDPSNAKTEERDQTEAERAAEISATTGRKIEVNDDGIIIDKREMMVGGLNIIPSKKKVFGPTLPGGFSAPIAARTAPTTSGAGGGVHASSSSLPFLSAAERGKQSRERHSREIERQMVKLDSKRKREAEEMLEEKVKKVVKRNDGTKVEELKRKAEERRVKREAEAKEAALLESAAGET